MSDAEGLERDLGSGRLVPPWPDVPNLVDLANAVAAVAGARTGPPTAGAETVADLIGPADHLVVVAADGLGMSVVESPPTGGFLRRHLAATLRTTFPSTTAAALTSLATGERPNRQAALGWYIHIPEIDAVSTIIPFARSADGAPLSDLGLAVDRAFRAPSMASAAPRQVLALLPSVIADSACSRYVGGGGRRARAHAHPPVRPRRRPGGPRERLCA